MDPLIVWGLFQSAPVLRMASKEPKEKLKTAKAPKPFSLRIEFKRDLNKQDADILFALHQPYARGQFARSEILAPDKSQSTFVLEFPQHDVFRVQELIKPWTDEHIHADAKSLKLKFKGVQIAF